MKLAKQRLIESGVSDEELKEYKRVCFIHDSRVVTASHNRLIAISNVRYPETRRDIKFLFDEELQTCL